MGLMAWVTDTVTKTGIVSAQAPKGITEWIAFYATSFIDQVGYLGIMILMVLESMVAPVPSEAVMPFAGFLIAQGKFTFLGVIFFSTLGSIIGSLIGYWMGAAGGRPLVERWGKYLLLDKSDLDVTEKWFARHGEVTVFICRFIPVVRHLISIPAGISKMNLWKFSIYTVIGAGIWNSILTVAGFYLKNNWNEIMKYSHIIDYVVVAVLVLAFVYYVYKFYKNRKKGHKSKVEA